MSCTVIDGNLLARQLREKLGAEITAQRSLNPKLAAPGLAVILVGEDPASQVYVRNKIQACNDIGINSYSYTLASDTSQYILLDLINKLNQDPEINGILIQLPLPKHIETKVVLNAINPNKDVDGFHPLNIGKLIQNQATLRPCTPYGIMQILEAYKINISSMHAVIIGTSDIVGKPMAIELLNKNATITCCNIYTKYLAEHVHTADLVISATGHARLIKGSWLKSGSIVIDVGTSRDETGKIIGDVEFTEAIKRASLITPVPGGVGPMTITALLQNTLTAQKLLNQPA